ncbi:MAG TPA: hypothetical protein VHV30_05385, partial [Polyangiaceae bacterium]|nr:hypothetical protein [Polyangiaceae bacterium]
MTDQKSDPKKGPDDPGEVDWDSALSDWESKNFVPEVAKDVTTDKPAALSTVSRPLYRPPPSPPKAPPAPKAKAPAAPVRPAPPWATPQGSKAPPPPAAPAAPSKTPTPDEPPPDDGDDATVISAIPRELLRAPQPPAGARKPGAPEPPKAPPRAPPAAPSRGGLGQFFARDDRRDDAQSKSATRARGDLREDMVTSAQAVPGRDDRSGVGPLRRPPQPDAAPEVPDGAMFDPFREPRTEQLTIPADSELAALLEDRALPSRPPAAGEPPPENRTPSVLVPDDRKYDPEDETITGTRADILEALGPPPPPSEPPRSSRRRTAPPPLPLPDPMDAAPAAPLEPAGNRDRTWEDERTAGAWLDDETRDALLERAAWLEAEARELPDALGQARGLLAVSELLAMAGERARGEAIAAESRDLAPSLALTHRQARGLMPVASVPGARVEALDLEIKMTPAGPARAFSMLLSADAAAADGDVESAAKRLAQAARLAPTDARVAADRAAQALASRDPSAPAALRFADDPELARIADALRTCVRLRGGAADARRTSPNEVLLQSRQALDRGDLPGAAACVAELARVPELAGAALWLASALGAPRKESRATAIACLQRLVERGDAAARRPLAARALETADVAVLSTVIEAATPLSAGERLVLATLSGQPVPEAVEGDTEGGLEADAPLRPLIAAAAALELPGANDARHDARAKARASKTAGGDAARALVEIGRLLGASGAGGDVEAALASLPEGERPAEARAIAMEMAARGGRFADVSATIEGWSASRATPEERAAASFAAA